MNEGMRMLSYLISGVLVYGAAGWAGDHFLGTKFLLPIGIVLGAALAVYVIIRRVRFLETDRGGAPAESVGAGRTDRTRGAR